MKQNSSGFDKLSRSIVLVYLEGDLGDKIDPGFDAEYTNKSLSTQVKHSILKFLLNRAFSDSQCDVMLSGRDLETNVDELDQESFFVLNEKLSKEKSYKTLLMIRGNVA